MHEKGWLRNFQGEQSESVRERRGVSDAWCLSVHGRWDEDYGDMFSPPPEQCFMSLKSEGTTEFPTHALLSPHLCHSYIQSHLFESNFPCNNKAFANVWVAVLVCLCRLWECACARVCWDEKVALCSRQSRSEDETIKHVREDMRETALRTESDSKSENEKVLVWDGVRVRKEERERSYSQPSCMCLMSITSFNQEKYVCIQIKHKTPLLPGALLPCLFVLLQAAC